MTALCRTCNRNPERVNSAVAECSHVDCPHRRRAWSERPQPVRTVHPKKPYTEADPVPLDKELKK